MRSSAPYEAFSDHPTPEQPDLELVDTPPTIRRQNILIGSSPTILSTTPAPRRDLSMFLPLGTCRDPGRDEIFITTDAHPLSHFSELAEGK